MKRIGNSFDIDQSLIESCEILVSELYGALSKVSSLLYKKHNIRTASTNEKRTDKAFIKG